jgi:hypothetical protein
LHRADIEGIALDVVGATTSGLTSGRRVLKPIIKLGQLAGRAVDIDWKRGSRMTEEERFAKLEDNMLVQAELVARLERRVDQFTEDTREWIKHTEAWSHEVQRWVAQAEARLTLAEARMTQLEAMSTAILERMDRFIQGREGNGHKPLE